MQLCEKFRLLQVRYVQWAFENVTFNLSGFWVFIERRLNAVFLVAKFSLSDNDRASCQWTVTGLFFFFFKYVIVEQVFSCSVCFRQVRHWLTDCKTVKQIKRGRSGTINKTCIISFIKHGDILPVNRSLLSEPCHFHSLTSVGAVVH